MLELPTLQGEQNVELHFDNLCQGNEAILKVNVF